MTKEKPILFSTLMVTALLNTKPNTWPPKPIDPEKPFKSQTRRVIKPQPDDYGVNGVTVEGFQTALYQADEYWINTEKGESVQVKPICKKGDILWVREKFRRTGDSYGVYYHFVDEYQNPDKYDWNSPLFLPRKNARLFLEVLSVNVERLQEISEKEAKAEGVEPSTTPDIPGVGRTYRQGFGFWWNEIKAKRGYSWDSNPWVWVIEFRRIEK